MEWNRARRTTIGIFLFILVVAANDRPGDTVTKLDQKNPEGTIEVAAVQKEHPVPKGTNEAQDGKTAAVRRLQKQLEELQSQLDDAKRRRLPGGDNTNDDGDEEKEAIKRKPWHKDEDKSFKPKLGTPKLVEADPTGSDDEMKIQFDNLRKDVSELGGRITNLKRYTADMVKMLYIESNETTTGVTHNPLRDGSAPMNLEDALERMCPSESRRARLAQECASHDSAISERVYDAESWAHIDTEHICFTSNAHDLFWKCVCAICPIPFRLNPEHYDEWKNEYNRRGCKEKHGGRHFPNIGDNACDFVGKSYPQVAPDAVKPHGPASGASDIVLGKTPMLIAAVTLTSALVGGLFLVMK